MASEATIGEDAKVPLWRLHVLRAMYLVMVAGLAITMWTELVDPPGDWPLMRSVVVVLLSSLGALCILGLRQPLDMLPLLLFELLWKMTWLVAVALPLWFAGALDAARAQTAFDCALGLILVPVIPWGYVLDRYIRRTGARWR